MTQQKLIQADQSELKCKNCPFFKDYHDRGRGECLIFDKVVRRDHPQTQDCRTAISSEELQEILDTHNAFLTPIALNFPGRNVYKQDRNYKSSSKVGYVGENQTGWFAHDRHGLTVAEGLPTQNEAMKALLGTCKPVELSEDRSPSKTSEINFNTDELPEEYLPHSEFEPGSIVKVIDEDEEDHTEWADFVVLAATSNSHRFDSTESYLSEPDWLYLIAES